MLQADSDGSGFVDREELEVMVTGLLTRNKGGEEVVRANAHSSTHAARRALARWPHPECSVPARVCCSNYWDLLGEGFLCLSLNLQKMRAGYGGGHAFPNPHSRPETALPICGIWLDSFLHAATPWCA